MVRGRRPHDEAKRSAVAETKLYGSVLEDLKRATQLIEHDIEHPIPIDDDLDGVTVDDMTEPIAGRGFGEVRKALLDNGAGASLARIARARGIKRPEVFLWSHWESVTTLREKRERSLQDLLTSRRDQQAFEKGRDRLARRTVRWPDATDRVILRLARELSAAVDGLLPRPRRVLREDYLARFLVMKRRRPGLTAVQAAKELGCRPETLTRGGMARRANKLARGHLPTQGRGIDEPVDPELADRRRRGMQ